MKDIVLASLLFILAACAPMPIPTASPPQTDTPQALPTALPIHTTTPLPTATATETILPTSTPTLTPTPVTTPVAYARNPRAILIEADIAGGLAPAPRDAHVPKFCLYADGFLIFAGEPAPLSSGLDAVVRTGYLSDAQIQNLLAYLREVGFFALNSFYQPRPTPTDMPTARISVYLDQVKTVQVYAPGFQGTPQNFSDALERILKTLPADAQTFAPTSGYLLATPAGTTSDLAATANLGEWANVGIRLADATDGVTVSGRSYTVIAALIARTFPNTLYREGERVYRVRFTPNLPRAVHLTDWLSAILDAPREFDGRVFEIVGYYRGWNVYGEARGSPPVTRSDWVIADASGAMYVTGAAPRGLNPSSREDAWTVVRLVAKVVYVRLRTSYLEARRVEILPSVSPTATPTPLSGAEAAIAAVKARFPEVAHIKPTPPGTIGASTNITVILPRVDAWYLVFWEGWGDCPSGCINNRYHYFIVKDGQATKVGEYARIYNAATNSFDTTGAPMWGVPK